MKTFEISNIQNSPNSSISRANDSLYQSAENEGVCCQYALMFKAIRTKLILETNDWQHLRANFYEKVFIIEGMMNNMNKEWEENKHG
jgi:hypothetical protein